MKQILIAVSLITAVAGQAQTKKPTPAKPSTTKSTPAKPATAVKPLKNATDSLSYAIGLSLAQFYKSKGVTNISGDMIGKAVKDVMAGKPELMTTEQANQTIMLGMDPGLKQRLNAGAAFLAENKKKPGVMTTPSGLQYEVITMGSGPKPTPEDQVVVNYAGRLTNGTEFDNSYKRGEPLTIGVGQVIRGWTEALQLMPVGSKFKLYIPQELGYGLNDAGSIPSGSVLVFDVELLSIAPKK